MTAEFTVLVVPILDRATTVRGYGAVIVAGYIPSLALLMDIYPIDVFRVDSPAALRDYATAFISEHAPPWDRRDIHYVQDTRGGPEPVFELLDSFMHFKEPLYH